MTGTPRSQYSNVPRHALGLPHGIPAFSAASTKEIVPHSAKSNSTPMPRGAGGQARHVGDPNMRALLPRSGLHPPASKDCTPPVVLGPCQTIDSFPVLASQTARTICSPPEATSCALTADSCMSSSWHSRTHSCGARVRAARLGHTTRRTTRHTTRLTTLTTPPWLPAARGCAARPPSSPGHSRRARARSRGRWRPQSRAPPERGGGYS